MTHKRPFCWLKGIVSQYRAALTHYPNHGSPRLRALHPHHHNSAQPAPPPFPASTEWGSKPLSLSASWIYTLCSGLAKAHQGGSPLANSWANAMARYSEHHSLVSDLRAAEQAVTRRTECHHHTRRTEHCTSTQQIAPSGAIATMQFIRRISGNQRAARTENVPSHMRPGWFGMVQDAVHIERLLVEIPLLRRSIVVISRAPHRMPLPERKEG